MAKTKRIEVTPDRNGKVVVVCGDDVLELVIKSAAEARASAGIAGVAGSRLGRIDINHGYAYSVKDPQWFGDVDDIVSGALAEHRDPKTRKVRSIVVKSPTLDLHALNRLSGKLERHLPQSGLRVDLRSRSRRG